MDSTARSLGSEHPVFADRDLFDEVAGVMHAVIQKKLDESAGGKSRQGTGSERVLIGGVSADDVLQDAMTDLSVYPPENVTSSWAALGVTIAKHKAADAVKAARKGLRGTEHRHEIKVESGDAPIGDPEGEPGATIWDLHPDERLNPEEEYLILRSALDLRDLAREVLDERTQTVFFGIRFQDRTRVDLSTELDLTPQRIGQIYDEACSTLENHPRYPHDLGP